MLLSPSLPLPIHLNIRPALHTSSSALPHPLDSPAASTHPLPASTHHILHPPPSHLSGSTPLPHLPENRVWRWRVWIMMEAHGNSALLHSIPHSHIDMPLTHAPNSLAHTTHSKPSTFFSLSHTSPLTHYPSTESNPQTST